MYHKWGVQSRFWGGVWWYVFPSPEFSAAPLLFSDILDVKSKYFLFLAAQHSVRMFAGTSLVAGQDHFARAFFPKTSLLQLVVVAHKVTSTAKDRCGECDLLRQSEPTTRESFQDN